MNPYFIEIVSSTLLKTIVRTTVKRLGFPKLLASSSNQILRAFISGGSRTIVGEGGMLHVYRGRTTGGMGVWNIPQSLKGTPENFTIQVQNGEF